MDELKNLQSLGLVLPTPAYIFGAIVFGIVGYVAFRRGRKTSTASLTWTGVALMMYPYAVAQTWLLWAIGAVLCAWLYAKWN
jgi:ABC-type Fe3+-siderophore transport system permease subunit